GEKLFVQTLYVPGCSLDAPAMTIRASVPPPPSSSAAKTDVSAEFRSQRNASNAALVWVSVTFIGTASVNCHRSMKLPSPVAARPQSVTSSVPLRVCPGAIGLGAELQTRS